MKPGTKILIGAAGLAALIAIHNYTASDKTTLQRKELIKRFGSLDNGNTGIKLSKMSKSEIEDIYWLLITRNLKKPAAAFPDGLSMRIAAIELKYHLFEPVIKQSGVELDFSVLKEL